MAIEYRCAACGDERRVLSEVAFRCTCGGQMARSDRQLPAAVAGRPGADAVPDARGLGWGSVVLGGFLLFGVLLIWALLAVAANGQIRIPADMKATLRLFAMLQFLLSVGIIAGDIALLASGGRFVWILYPSLAGFVLLRIADFILAAKSGQAGAGTCGSICMLAVAAWLLVRTEQQRRAVAAADGS